MKLAALVSRNLRLLVRSRTTILIIILAPLLAVLLAAMSFDNNNQYVLKIGVYGESYPRVANQFLDELAASSFQVDRLPSEASCRKSVEAGRHHACLLFASDAQKAVSITMLVDFSKVQVVDALLNRVSDKVALKSSQISLNMTDALVRRVQETRDEVDKNRYLITSLTTGQETIGVQLDELNAKLAAVDPKVDLTAPKKFVAALENNEVVTQFDSINRLKDDLIARIGSLSKEMDDGLKDSAVSEADKNRLRSIVAQNDVKVRRIGDEFRAASALTQKDLDSLKDQLSAIIAHLESIEGQVEAARDAKMDANVQIRRLKGTLDENLIKIVVLQTALNRIGAPVKDLKVPSGGLRSPISTDIQPIASSPSRLNVIFPTVLVFLVMVACTLLSVSLVSSHRQNPGSVRDALMPVHPVTRLLALFATVLVLVVIQTVAVVGLAGAVLGPGIIAGLPAAGTVLLSLIVLFALVGMTIGFAVATEQGAVIAGVAVTSAAFVFSDVLLPLEAMPPSIASLASMNPFVIGSELVRRALVFHAPVSSVMAGVLLLSVYALGCCVMILFQHREDFV